ncbi:hypothetical protein OJAV_G00120550 [Oryzias javanicus]|uniref:Uncharacterized protein n=1 Tax=Oryzias javanicus TaxID=123683 RepID=A0A3S2PNP4_ORYJA|nr:hypothetical protein OJAV_G00120550 [Oryzias javanicus]
MDAVDATVAWMRGARRPSGPASTNTAWKRSRPAFPSFLDNIETAAFIRGAARKIKVVVGGAPGSPLMPAKAGPTVKAL